MEHEDNWKKTWHRHPFSDEPYCTSRVYLKVAGRGSWFQGPFLSHQPNKNPKQVARIPARSWQLIVFCTLHGSTETKESTYAPFLVWEQLGTQQDDKNIKVDKVETGSMLLFVSTKNLYSTTWKHIAKRQGRNLVEMNRNFNWSKARLLQKLILQQVSVHVPWACRTPRHLDLRSHVQQNNYKHEWCSSDSSVLWCFSSLIFKVSLISRLAVCKPTTVRSSSFRRVLDLFFLHCGQGLHHIGLKMKAQEIENLGC